MTPTNSLQDGSRLEPQGEGSSRPLPDRAVWASRLMAESGRALSSGHSSGKGPLLKRPCCHHLAPVSPLPPRAHRGTGLRNRVSVGGQGVRRGCFPSGLPATSEALHARNCMLNGAWKERGSWNRPLCPAAVNLCVFAPDHRWASLWPHVMPPKSLKRPYSWVLPQLRLSVSYLPREGGCQPPGDSFR